MQVTAFLARTKISILRCFLKQIIINNNLINLNKYFKKYLFHLKRCSSTRLLVAICFLLVLSLEQINCKTCKLTTDCANSNLACDINKRICLKVQNQQCVNNTECVNNLVCQSGKCGCQVI